MAVLAALTISMSAANAASYSVGQGFYASGDFATGVYDDNYMPSFDTARGTLDDVLIRVNSTLQWGEPFVATSTPDQTGVVEDIGAAHIFGDDGDWEFDAPARFVSFRGNAPTMFPSFSIQGTFYDDPSLYLDPSNPEDLLVVPTASESCYSNCIELFEDDAGGTLSGTLTTTFFYTPFPHIPEPAGWSLLLLSGLATAGLRFRRRS